MKKTNLLALGAVLAFGLASCGGIDYSKPFLKANGEIGGAKSTFEIYLKEGNKAFFDFNVEAGKLPDPAMEEKFNSQFDMNGTYKVAEKDYVFTFTMKMGEQETNKEFTAKYVTGKDYTHELEFPMMTDLGPKTFTLTGNLPL